MDSSFKMNATSFTFLFVSFLFLTFFVRSLPVSFPLYLCNWIGNCSVAHITIYIYIGQSYKNANLFKTCTILKLAHTFAMCNERGNTKNIIVQILKFKIKNEVKFSWCEQMCVWGKNASNNFRPKFRWIDGRSKCKSQRCIFYRRPLHRNSTPCSIQSAYALFFNQFDQWKTIIRWYFEMAKQFEIRFRVLHGFH